MMKSKASNASGKKGLAYMKGKFRNGRERKFLMELADGLAPSNSGS